MTKYCEQHQTMWRQSKIMVEVLPRWRFSPPPIVQPVVVLTWLRMARFLRRQRQVSALIGTYGWTELALRPRHR
jgi:hypothetical protein